MSWSMLWAYFSNQTDEIKRHIWEQIDLPNFLKALAPEYQNEVMEHAPDEIKIYIRKLLAEPVRKPSMLSRLVRN